MKKVLALDEYLAVASDQSIEFFDYDHNSIFKIETLDSLQDMSYGVVGDGCGGGRLFILELHKVKVFDFETREIMELFDHTDQMYSMSKKKCDLFIVTDKSMLKFNLSLMKLENF